MVWNNQAITEWSWEDEREVTPRGYLSDGHMTQCRAVHVMCHGRYPDWSAEIHFCAFSLRAFAAGRDDPESVWTMPTTSRPWDGSMQGMTALVLFRPFIWRVPGKEQDVCEHHLVPRFLIKRNDQEHFLVKGYPQKHADLLAIGKRCVEQDWQSWRQEL